MIRSARLRLALLASLLVYVCASRTLGASQATSATPAGPAASSGRSADCTPKLDTLRDTVFAVLAAAGPPPGLARSELLPVLRGVLLHAHRAGVGHHYLSGLPGSALLDLRTGDSARLLPARFAKIPGEYAFILHRDGSVTGARVVTPGHINGFDEDLMRNFVRVDTLPAERFAPPAAEPARVFPASIAGDSLPLRLSFAIRRDTSGANVVFALRGIVLVHLDHDAVPAPDNPSPVFPKGFQGVDDTVVVQLDVDPDGHADVASAHPVRPYLQPFIDAVVAVLPRLRYAPALAGGCPTRSEIIQAFVLRSRAVGR